MKNKFLILSLLVSSFFIACSSDDDGGNNNDPIIGEWRYSGYTVEGEEEELSGCDMLDTFIYNAEGTFNFLYYYESGTDCELDGEETGTWSNKGSGIYNFEFESEETDVSITFSNNNNTLTLSVEEGGMLFTEIYTRVTK